MHMKKAQTAHKEGHMRRFAAAGGRDEDSQIRAKEAGGDRLRSRLSGQVGQIVVACEVAWKAARVAAAAMHATLLPKFAREATRRKPPGTNGAIDSSARAPFSHPAAVIRHRFASVSNRSEINEAETTAAS